MSRVTLCEIVDHIEPLPVEDRDLLDDLLAEREERDWRREATEARREARQDGLDQEAIDRAVRAVRHGE